MNIQFANQTGNATQYTTDIITGDNFTHKLTSHIIDGQQRLTLKKDGFKIATLQPEYGQTISQDEAKDWAKATIIAIQEKLDQLDKATSQASEAESSYREALKQRDNLIREARKAGAQQKEICETAHISPALARRISNK